MEKGEGVKKDYGLFVLEVVAVLFILAYFYNLYRVNKNNEIFNVEVHMFSKDMKYKAIYLLSRQENEKCVYNIVNNKKYTLNNIMLSIDDKNISLSSLLTQEYKKIDKNAKDDDYE